MSWEVVEKPQKIIEFGSSTSIIEKNYAPASISYRYGYPTLMLNSPYFQILRHFGLGLYFSRFSELKYV